MRGLLLAALLALPLGAARAKEDCWLLCSEELDLQGAEARARLEGWLGAALPPGSEVEHLREGGFQDTFVQARLEVDGPGLAALLGALGLTTGDFGPVAPGQDAPTDPPWWDWQGRKGVKVAEGRLPLLPFASIYVAPEAGEPGRWTAYLWAFQT